jgi:hypothetical protein
MYWDLEVTNIVNAMRSLCMYLLFQLNFAKSTPLSVVIVSVISILCLLSISAGIICGDLHSVETAAIVGAVFSALAFAGAGRPHPLWIGTDTYKHHASGRQWQASWIPRAATVRSPSRVSAARFKVCWL